MGDLNSIKKRNGYIRGKINRNNIRVRIKQEKDNVVNISVSAKKLLRADPAAAAGILYEIVEKIKKKQ